ncbi:unnamed protein product, partial [Laminaria digitata]
GGNGCDSSSCVSPGLSPLAAASSSPVGLMSRVPDPPRSEAPRLSETACNTPCDTPSALVPPALTPSASSPSVLTPSRAVMPLPFGPSPFPWSKEVAHWYGRVSLVVAPGLAVDEAAAASTPAHSLLLTDKALYVIETRRPGGGGCSWMDPAGTAETGGDTGSGASKRLGDSGSDSLCRLERDRVESLSLPLEARVLPN